MAEMSPNEWQTILERSRRSILRDKERERREVEQQVGHFIVTWSFVDVILTMAVAHLAGERQQKWAIKPPAAKIKKLEELLPFRWSDTVPLIELLSSGNALRNAMAHGNLAMGGWDGEKALDWHLVDFSKPSRPRIELDPKVMKRQSLDADIAREAVQAIMGSESDAARHTGDMSFKIGPLVKVAPGIWDDDESFLGYMARVTELFPG